MKISNPKVTLSDEARVGVEEQVRSGFLDWLHQFSVKGDDGELYSIGGAILSMHLEKMDVVNITVAKGKGCSRQLPNSIYKVGEYHGALVERMWRHPSGTLDIQEKGHSVVVTCGEEYKVECFEDNSWHLMLDTLDGEYSADLWHKPKFAPLWYGKEKPSYLTQHSITYGYNWAGDVEGRIRLKGKEINVSGMGIRERYVAVDSCAAELGGWEDWGWIGFDEIHSSMYDMRLGMKDFAMYDLKTGKYYPEGKLTIKHEDWVFLREIGGFIPETYKIDIEVEDGLYAVTAKVCNATTWGATHKVPDNPVATLTFDKVEGTFTDRNGECRTLTGGKGTMSIREWHAYPNILPRELYLDGETPVNCQNKFDTL
ncbi:MAG: hypothetical protein ACI358_00785 [Candidatus Limimorpha sp.]